jgi:hypothetical protein
MRVGGPALTPTATRVAGEVDCSRWPGIDENSYSIKSPCQIHHIREYPTVRAFNPALGPHGLNYTGDATVEGLKGFIVQTLEKLCMLDGDALVPNAVCSKKEASFAEQWKTKPLEEVEKELGRMQAVYAKASEDRFKETTALVTWMGMRINLLKQIVVQDKKKQNAQLKGEL